MTILRLLLIAVFVPSQAFATDYYVQGSGTGTTCMQAQSIGTPHDTITEGLACLSSGDTLYIRAGDYAETITNVVSGSSFAAPTTVSCYNGEPVTLNPTGSALAVISLGGAGDAFVVFNCLSLNPSGMTLGNSGFGIFIISGAGPIRFQNGAVHDAVRDCAYLDPTSADGSQFLNNEMEGCGIPCVSNGTCRTTFCNAGYCGHGIYIGSDDVLVRSNHLHGIAGYGVHLFGTGGGVLENAQVLGNRIHDNGQAADFGGEAFGAGILIGGTGSGNTGTLVANNLIYDNHFRCVTMGFGGGATAPQFLNNTCFSNDNGACLRLESTIAGALVGNNICDGHSDQMSNAGSGTTFQTNLCSAAGTGCTTGTIGFVNTSVFDFRLTAGSAARNTGTSYAGTVDTDVAGSKRPAESVYDRGAYEYFPVPGAPSDLRLDAPPVK